VGLLEELDKRSDKEEIESIEDDGKEEDEVEEDDEAEMEEVEEEEEDDARRRFMMIDSDCHCGPSTVD